MNGDTSWITAGVSFLAGVLVLGIITAIVVLIDIRVELTQSGRRQRRGQAEPDEFSSGITWESRKRKHAEPEEPQP